MTDRMVNLVGRTFEAGRELRQIGRVFRALVQPSYLGYPSRARMFGDQLPAIGVGLQSCLSRRGPRWSLPPDGHLVTYAEFRRHRRESRQRWLEAQDRL